MRIAVVGTGYVGLVAGACFADAGNQVVCIDRDPHKIERLRRGEIPIYEPGLEDLVKRAAAQKHIQFTTAMQEGVRDAEIIFLAVGTPAGTDGEPNLSYLRSACEELAPALTRPVVIVNKSTVPIGSHRVVADWIQPLARVTFEVVSNPEFLKEGSAVDDFLRPDRVVIGTDSDAAFEKMEELYAPFVRQGNPILRMDPVSAEMTKYACNAFLATRISFMNELARLCDRVGGDIERVRRGMASDQRIGKHFLYAGAGYGGSCFPKDVQALLATAEKSAIPLEVVRATESANERQKLRLVELIEEDFGKDSLEGQTFAVWGLAFKPQTDDMREAPSLVVIRELVRLGAQVRAYDPIAQTTGARALEEVLGATWRDHVALCSSAMEAVEGVQAVVLITEWNEFRQVDWSAVGSQMRVKGQARPRLYDGRNLFDPKQIAAQGWEYRGIGRGEFKR